MIEPTKNGVLVLLGPWHAWIFLALIPFQSGLAVGGGLLVLVSASGLWKLAAIALFAGAVLHLRRHYRLMDRDGVLGVLLNDNVAAQFEDADNKETR